MQRVLDRGAPAIETPERDAFEAAEDAMVLMPFLDVAAPVPAETLLEHLRGRTETTLLSVNPKGIASKGIASECSAACLANLLARAVPALI